ncbi:MAG: cation transporter, partial [Ignavibacteriae bacterium]|nr:cation transporter [Ignavibacteriota bacterium]
MSHNHSHNNFDLSKSNLLIIILLNFLITVAEIIGGIISGSLSLISD